MLVSTTISFILLIAGGVVLETVLRRWKKSTNHNPQFLAFQKTFLAAEIVLLLADWLQAPYNYKVFKLYCDQAKNVTLRTGLS